jgi:hypothetical protein
MLVRLRRGIEHVELELPHVAPGVGILRLLVDLCEVVRIGAAQVPERQLGVRAREQRLE